jgi:transglutaminase-like putative cysteine protease
MSSDPKSKPESSLKKQLISLGIIVVLVVGGWYLSAVISGLIFKQGRYDSVQRLDQTDPETVDLDAISPPNFTVPDDWGELDLDLLNLLAGLPFLAGALGFGDMDMDDLDTPIFRVYEQSGTIDDNDLWRLSAYDEYLSNGWQRSNQIENPLSDSTLPGSADFTIRFPFGETTNERIALPTVILDGITSPEIYKIHAEEGPGINIPMNSYNLQITSQKGAVLEFQLAHEAEGNLTYDIFQTPYPPDPSLYDTYNFDSSHAPTLIKNQYLQFPNNDKTAYYNSHSNFQTHIMNVATLIGGETRTYEIAVIIRDYLASNFQIDLSFPLERPGSSDDIVDWFLGRGEGLPMDFAAAFVMMCRWFDIPCRYTMGYNSRFISTEQDPSFGNQNYREIKLSNMDAWNEIYFPTDASGGGEFAPFIISPSFSLPTQQDPKDLNILINGTYSTYSAGLRGYDVELGFELDENVTGGNAFQDLELTDHTEEVSLGTIQTDGTGSATYTVHLDNSYTAGAHFISARFGTQAQNACAIILVDALNIEMSPPSVFSINRSISNDTDVIAYIYDPVNNNRVKNAILHPVLTLADAALTNSINPTDIKVDNNGTIDQTVTISEYVAQGSYRIRVDFNGTYEIVNPLTGIPQSINIPTIIDASSNDYPFQVIDDNQKVFNLDIDGSVFQENIFYKDRDTDSMTFNVYLEQASVPVVGGKVDIFDRTYGNYKIATITTVAGGTGSAVYTLSADLTHWVAGVHELYGEWQGVGRLNQSFYLIVDEVIDIEFTSSVTPSTINRVGISPTEFSISGRVYDPGLGVNVRYGVIAVRMMQGVTDYTSSLTGDMIYQNVGFDGTFTATYGVLPTTPLGIYNIHLGFFGDYLLEDSFGQHITDSGFVPIMDAGTETLTVNDPSNILIEMWIDYTPTQGSYPGSSAPQYSRGNNVRIDITLWEGIAVKPSTTVRLYDETRGRVLASTITNSSGGATFMVNLNNTFVAGLNRLSVSYSTVKNYTQIHLDDTMYVDIVTIPAASSTRGPTGQISIAGYVRDSTNGYIVKGASMQLFVRDFGGTDRTTDITSWLLGSTSRFQTSDPTTGQFLYSWRMPISFIGVYRITVYFDGAQTDPSIACQAFYSDGGLAALSSEYLTTVYAKSQLDATYHPQTLLPGNPVYVDGALTYDNGTDIVSATVTIEFYNGGSLKFSDTDTTDGSGVFHYSTTVLWGVDEIRVVFAQDDSNYIRGSDVEAIYI